MNSILQGCLLPLDCKTSLHHLFVQFELGHFLAMMNFCTKMKTMKMMKTTGGTTTQMKKSIPTSTKVRPNL